MHSGQFGLNNVAGQKNSNGDRSYLPHQVSHVVYGAVDYPLLARIQILLGVEPLEKATADQGIESAAFECFSNQKGKYRCHKEQGNIVVLGLFLLVVQSLILFLPLHCQSHWYSDD